MLSFSANVVFPFLITGKEKGNNEDAEKKEKHQKQLLQFLRFEYDDNANYSPFGSAITKRLVDNKQILGNLGSKFIIVIINLNNIWEINHNK